MSVTQAEQRRNKTGQPVGGQKGVVAEPSPADTLGHDKADRAVSPLRLQKDLVNALEPSATVIGGQTPETFVELLRAPAGDHAGIGEASPLVILRQGSLHCLRFE